MMKDHGNVGISMAAVTSISDTTTSHQPTFCIPKNTGVHMKLRAKCSMNSMLGWVTKRYAKRQYRIGHTMEKTAGCGVKTGLRRVW